jgi:NADH:ubiquinone reductase (H+-translocating)
MLYQVATCGILPYDIAIPLRPFSTCRGIEFRRALVEVIDFDHQIVKCDTGDIAYDFLIVALGSTTNYFGNTSAGRHALPVKSLEEGLAIRNRVIDALGTGDGRLRLRGATATADVHGDRRGSHRRRNDGRVG